jgi:hypothetical protein
MTRILHIDPFGGAAGDMLLGGLLDLGADPAAVSDALRALSLPGWRLEAAPDRHQGFAGTRVRVIVDRETHPARRLADVESLLTAESLPGRARQRALAAFRRLFEAEAEVHGLPVAETHLHELAAIDAVIDIVGVCVAVELLGIQRIVCGPVPVGSGTVTTAHGILPVPGPAVARLLRGVPVAGHAADGEMTTPTGATLLVTLADAFGPLPGGTITAVGVGLGTRKFAGLPNMLRLFLLERDDRERLTGRPMVLVETTVDDVPGEALGFLQERMRAAGARDAWCLAGTGRKGRPVAELRALCEPERVEAVVAALFTEGATLGVRLVECARPELERATAVVETPFGSIPVKLGGYSGRVVSAKPEHDACVAAAARSGAAVAVVVDAARRAAPAVGSRWPSGDPGDSG